MATHRTEFDVGASDEQVWAVLTDFEHYADWNPSLPSITGELREGSTVSLKLVLPGRPSLSPKADLLELIPNRRLTWRGHLGADRLFTGYREFAIDPLTENKVRVTHVEDLQSLKSRAEAMAAQAATGG